ncbi:hypothetical protein COJ21_09775 [Priestia megaterium]|uniref:hypothetical protein n=1 Tax=Priestia megaterium TaxID=1404 RepID=UPI000BF7C235|nr:hypothetical protein [Priestia megaterium]PFK77401.1 hypothetical protein COJ21_09775 [Priestia megaterium]
MIFVYIGTSNNVELGVTARTYVTPKDAHAGHEEMKKILKEKYATIDSVRVYQYIPPAEPGKTDFELFTVYDV